MTLVWLAVLALVVLAVIAFWWFFTPPGAASSNPIVNFLGAATGT
jgi:hypothetical protein